MARLVFYNQLGFVSIRKIILTASSVQTQKEVTHKHKTTKKVKQNKTNRTPSAGADRHALPNQSSEL